MVILTTDKFGSTTHRFDYDEPFGEEFTKRIQMKTQATQIFQNETKILLVLRGFFQKAICWKIGD